MGLSIATTSIVANKLVTKQNTAGQQNINATATTTGVTSGASSAFGSWVQIVASTASEFYLTGIQVSSTAVIAATMPLVVQIGIGGAGSETVMHETGVALTGATSTGSEGYAALVIPVRVASGQRVAVRSAQANGSTLAVGVAVYGVPYANVEGN